MNQPKTSKLNIMFGFVFLTVVIACVVWVIIVFLETISQDTKVTLGIITLAGIIITNLIVTYYKHKHDIEAHYRDRKTEIYMEYLNTVFDLFLGSKPIRNETLIDFHKKWHQNLILWGSPGVTRSYIVWKTKLEESAQLDDSLDVEVETIFLLWDLVLEIRKDLGLSNWRLDRKIFTPLLLKEAEKIIAVYEKNPKAKLSEVR